MTMVQVTHPAVSRVHLTRAPTKSSPSGCTLDEVPHRPPRRLSEEAYLKHVEVLAKVVCDEAFQEGWLSYPPINQNQTSLQRAINDLATNLRGDHHEGDGCVHDGAAD